MQQDQKKSKMIQFINYNLNVRRDVKISSNARYILTNASVKNTNDMTNCGMTIVNTTIN